LVEIPQAGHFLVLEQPQAVAEAVTAFLREQ
jgi:pimeloyl-ACP methyl ester carboxylesterase